MVRGIFFTDLVMATIRAPNGYGPQNAQPHTPPKCWPSDTRVLICMLIVTLYRKGRIRGAFQRFDKDKQGSVSLEQACDILQGYLGFSETKAKQTVDVHDKNKDGRIDYEEFLEFFSMMEEE